MLRPHIQHQDIDTLLRNFEAEGYARLGKVLTEVAASELATRAQEMMEGDEPVGGVFYQHDSASGRYEDLAFNEGWVGPSPNYRKLERLERDPMFRAWIENPLFKRIATSLLGDGVQLYRTVLWNKAPNGGMSTPWHQDDGRFWGLERPPVLQIWTALDDASEAAGCLEVLPGSHSLGLASPEGGTITPAALERARAEQLAVPLPAQRGESILVHNHTWHRTGHNRTPHSRRALSVSFLCAETRCKRKRRTPRTFERLFIED